jgi:SAM-dependent methyltransferase
MIFSIKTLFYQLFIDPILSRLYSSVLSEVTKIDRVLDIACGTGALALTLAEKAVHVTGIDLNEESIAAARMSARRRETSNVLFEVKDASDLSCYGDKSFDVALTSMAVHQFDADLAIKILMEMKRIAYRVIVVDYNHHMPVGWGRRVAWGIERFAGGEHYRNFRVYMKKGGMHYFAREAAIKVKSEVLRGGGVFVVVKG